MASTTDPKGDEYEASGIVTSPVDIHTSEEVSVPAVEEEHDSTADIPQSEDGYHNDNQEPPAEEMMHTIDLNEEESTSSPPPESYVSIPLPPSSATAVEGASHNDSQSTLATVGTTKPMPRSSLLFVVSSLESIAASKDARRSKDLSAATSRALSAIKGDEPMSPEVLFAPLQLAAQTPNVQVVTTALDCIGKLISYSYFSLPSSTPPQDGESASPPLIERAIDTICDCFQSEATPVETQLQIVKSLLSAILNDKIVVHGAGLLKAVRMTYNIFLLSKSSANQTVAQGALTQMVGTVFERVRIRMENKEKRLNRSKSTDLTSKSDDKIDIEYENGHSGIDYSGEADADIDDAETASTAPSDSPVEKRDAPKITLQSFENRNSFDDAKITEAAPTLVTHLPKTKGSSGRVISSASDPNANVDGSHENVADAASEDEEDEIFVRDAYLVFRAMCRLTTKPLPVEHALDVKSQGMRSKLISLHIIYTILANHTSVFLSPYSTIRSSSNDEPTSFVQAIKQYLCLSLSRNGASSVKPVFEVSLEIFWLMIKLLRVMLKKEIEVFLKEIYLSVLEKRAAPTWQKQMILSMFSRLASDPRALVEVYLNYDCDRSALDNMFERIVEHLSRISSSPVGISQPQLVAYQEQLSRKVPPTPRDWNYRSMPPSLATVSLQAQSENELGYPPEYAMKHEALEVIVELLRSLVSWSQGSEIPLSAGVLPKSMANESRESLDKKEGYFAPSPRIGVDSPLGTSTPVPEDDPSQFDREKQRKTALAGAIRQFNFKPKRGVKTLIKEGFIRTDSPSDVARFLLHNEQINKTALGEFLGEGDKENIDIMHAFVELMDFRQTQFTEALRTFLQSFRLPGEAQKIDRFMLKFAERYITGNPNTFANADTAYVLAYSVIMLNTDQHSANIKGRRMTPEDFIKNNRGINDNSDLPDDYLKAIYDEIQRNEIVLNTEREAAANLGQLPVPTQSLASTIGQVVVNASRDHKREEYAQTEQIANRTEQLYKSLLRAQRRGALRIQVAKFIPASSFKHVGPMFQVTWMPFLTALSGAAQDIQDIETIRLCMEGQKLAIRIACMFDLADPRQAFVASLARFTNLYNLSEMKAKNMEALKVLLEVAYTEGNSLKDSWRDILTCISQLDRFQLISTGVDEGVLPDVGRQARGQAKLSNPRRGASKKTPRTNSGHSYQADIAEESRSTDIIRSVDRIFTNTANLDGDAIIYFVKALTQVSWQEIQSSGQSESPRTYSLQKIVEISGYNMTRVRFQWANIWQVLGSHFNQVGCHTNTHVVYFALDSLRQLSMRFLEIEELPGFKFQKDFLKPFEHIIGNTTVVAVKDMVLRCLIQMIQARGENIRSGWRTMFGVFTVAAREPYENIVNLAYDHVTQIYNTRFGVVISQGAFADLIVCLTQFSKNQKFQKKSLQAIEALKLSVSKLLRTPECPLSHRNNAQDSKEPKESSITSQQSQEEQFWFPVLFAFHDVLMTGDDLEVRSRALTYLFETLVKHGGDFPLDFWDTLWRQLLYPIFMVLRSKSEMSKVANHEELSVWLSTTMVQALRNMVILFTHFFESLEYMLDRFLDLLVLCICQENDTLARIGSNCLQQLILQNVAKFSDEDWNKIVNAFIELFTRTEASGLFSAAATPFSSKAPSLNGNNKPLPAEPDAQSFSDLNLSSPAPELTASNENVGLGIDTHLEDRPRQDWGSMGVASQGASTATSVDSEVPSPVDIDEKDHQTPRAKEQPTADLESYRPSSSSANSSVVITAARRRLFNQIITQCVLTLLMIETVSELFSNDAVYASIPSEELLRLMALLKKSYQFARRFNADRELRTRLFREGFMRQPPNLLKQESTAAATYVQILLRMYHDTQPERADSKAATEAALVPLCADILRSYMELDEETQARNIVTWRPVVVDVLEGYTGFGDEEFKTQLQTFAPLVVGLLGRELTPEIQVATQRCLARMVEISTGIPCQEYVLHGESLSRVASATTPSLGGRSRRGSSLKGGGKY